jgi:hypothetical protein
VRYIVVDSASSPLKKWLSHQQNVEADFLATFPGESDGVPPVMGVAIGADADNTADHSLGFVTDVTATAH